MDNNKMIIDFNSEESINEFLNLLDTELKKME